MVRVGERLDPQLYGTGAAMYNTYVIGPLKLHIKLQILLGLVSRF